MRILRGLLGIGVLVALLWSGWSFAGRNASLVTIDYLLGDSGEVSLWAALLVSFGAGAAVAVVLGLYQLAKFGLVMRRYRKTVQGLEAEVHQLRNLPLVAPESAPGAPAGAAARRGPPGAMVERGA